MTVGLYVSDVQVVSCCGRKNLICLTVFVRVQPSFLEQKIVCQECLPMTAQLRIRKLNVETNTKIFTDPDHRSLNEYKNHKFISRFQNASSFDLRPLSCEPLARVSSCWPEPPLLAGNA